MITVINVLLFLKKGAGDGGSKYDSITTRLALRGGGAKRRVMGVNERYRITVK